ncbi:MAG: hypothetical protein IH867_09775 [Chloroflexi bacterium]|nr:hypothetical protein [Chloroflexota bacterium]
MARTDAFPRAKGIVQQAALDNPRLTGGAAFRMLEELQTKEINQVADGRLKDPDADIPLSIPKSEKTPARWIAELPPYKLWDVDTASPAEFQVVARVFRELAESKLLSRMFTQVEAEKIARYGLILPNITAKALWLVARVAIITEANKISLEALNTWIMFNVPPMTTELNVDTPKDWGAVYRTMMDENFAKFPNLSINFINADGKLDTDVLKGSDAKGND